MPAKLIHEVHDLWPETLYMIGGMSEKHPFVRLLKKAANSAYKRSDLIVGFNNKLGGYLNKAYGVDADRYACVPLGINLEEWDPEAIMPLPDDLKDELEGLRAQGKFIVGYDGGHAISNALEDMIEAARLMQDRDSSVYFVLVGKGVEKQKLMDMASSYSLTNISFFDPINRKSIPELLKYFDCFYIGARGNRLYELAGMNPNKCYEAIMAGLPIIANLPSGIGSDFDRYSGTFFNEVGDINAICDNIGLIRAESHDKKALWSSEGKAFIEKNYTYTYNARKFEALMA